jgi:hypothetical protein
LIADICQIHFIRTGNFIAEDEVPSDLFATHMAHSHHRFPDSTSRPPAAPPSGATLEDGTGVFRISAISSDKMTEADL